MLTSPPVPYAFSIGNPISRLLTVGSTPIQHSVLNVKALVGAFNQEKALVVEPMDRFAALVTSDPAVITTPWFYPEHWTMIYCTGGNPSISINPTHKSFIITVKLGSVSYWHRAGEAMMQKKTSHFSFCKYLKNKSFLCFKLDEKNIFIPQSVGLL